MQPSGVSLASPVALIGPHYCASYPIDIAIVRKVLTLGHGNFVVTDINGNILFKVKEILFTFVHKRKLILDAAGNPIVTLRRKAMTARSRWQAFRGESTDEKDLIFTAKKHSMFYMKTKLDVFLANNTAEEVSDYKVKGSFFQRSCVVYAGEDESSTVAAQMHKKHNAQSILLGKDNFRVTVYPNIDYAFIVALIVILDDVNSEGRNSSSTSSTSGSGAGAH